MANQENKDEQQDFPGYPHYSPKEDIMNVKEVTRVDADVENLSRSNKIPPNSIQETAITQANSSMTGDIAGEEDDEVKIVSGTEADVTAEDLELLDGDYARTSTLDKTDNDEEELDVPGAEDDDANEEIGEEDEENNYYSLGGDAHEE